VRVGLASLALLLFRFSWDFVVEAYTALLTCRKGNQLASREEKKRKENTRLRLSASIY
jgi:hypothetical protein